MLILIEAIVEGHVFDQLSEGQVGFHFGNDFDADGFGIGENTFHWH